MGKGASVKIRCSQILLSCFLMLLISFGSVFAESEERSKTVVVIGKGTIYKGDSANAKELAIADSLVAAVDLITQELIPLESMIHHFQNITDTVYSRTVSFIEGYKVLAESKSGNTYRVIVEASVSQENLKKVLNNAGISLGKATMPKILFLIAEQNPEDELPLIWWGEELVFVRSICENTMSALMKKRGFPVLYHEGMLQGPNSEPVIYGANLTNEEAIHIGLLLNADVVIAGRSIARKTPNTMGDNIRTFKGTVDLRAIRVDTYEEIASTAQTAVSVNSDEIEGGKDAISRAAYMAGEALAAQINIHWHKETIIREGLVELIITGTDDLANFVKFRGSIKNIKGVKELLTKEMKPNEATLLVEFKGTANMLADALMLNTFEVFSINIYDITENRLKIELVSEQSRSEGWPEESTE